MFFTVNVAFPSCVSDSGRERSASCQTRNSTQTAGPYREHHPVSSRGPAGDLTQTAEPLTLSQHWPSGAERSGADGVNGRSSWILLKCTCSCRSAALELTMLALPKPHRKWPRTNDGRTHARVTDTFCWTSHRVRFTFPSLLNMKMDLGMTVLGHRSVWSESHETGPEHAQGVFHPKMRNLDFA